MCQVVAALQPAGAIVVDESLTSGNAYWEASKGCPQFSHMTLTGEPAAAAPKGGARGQSNEWLPDRSAAKLAAERGLQTPPCHAAGGAIGCGPPLSVGAAIACPGRTVINLQADGSGLYSVQALWTQAREKLDIVNVVFANQIYKILYGELVSVGAQPGRASNELFDLARPALDWVKLAGGMGMEAVRVDTLEAFADVFKSACGRKGPFLIEFRI